jgi:hypothetical protein
VSEPLSWAAAAEDEPAEPDDDSLRVSHTRRFRPPGAADSIGRTSAPQPCLALPGSMDQVFVVEDETAVPWSLTADTSA